MLEKIAQMFRSRVSTDLDLQASRRNRLKRGLHIESLEDRSLLSSIVWSPSTALPAPRSDAAAVLGTNHSVYLLGGNANTVEVQAPGSTSWANSPSIDKQRVAPGVGPLADGRILIFGGQNVGEAIEETYLYDPSNINSNDGPVMSNVRAEGAYATDPQSGLVYAIGGVNDSGSALNSVEKYNPNTNTWSSAASLPDSRSDIAAAADDAGHIFVFGGRRAGFGSNDVSNQVFRYNISTNDWQTMAPMPASLRDMIAVTGPNDGKIYVIGGRNATNPVASVYAYDYGANTWSVETSLITAVTDAAAVLDGDGRILVLGGRNSLGQIISDVQVTQDLDAVDTVPVFVSTPITTATSTATYNYQAVATGNPLPTFALVSPPSGMTINALGLISWTPNESHVGSRSVTVRATNRAGSIDQVFSIVVASSIPVITSTPVTNGETGVAYQYVVNATGAPNPTYALATSVAGMAIDATTGIITWTPTDIQVGNFNVTVTATNTNGSKQQSFVVAVTDRSVPTTPTLLTVASTTLNSVSLSWTSSSDNVGVSKYRVYEQYKYGWRNSRTGYRLKQDNIASNSTTIPGLTAGTSFKLVVAAVDAAGNESLRSNLVLATTLKLPTLSIYYGQISNVAATHEMLPIQVSGYGIPAPTLSLVSGPSGLTFDPATGVANWTPADMQVGIHAATFRATNSEGSATVTATINVQANLPVVSKTFAYFGTTFSTPFAVEGDPFELQLYETFTNSPITWSVVSGPTGMIVDPATGAVSWTPGAEHVGIANAVFRATNYAGSTDLPVSLTVHPLGTDLRAPTPVAGITVSVIDSTRAAITWAPSTDNVSVDSYRITSSYRTRSGRFMRTVTKTFTAPASATMFEMTGLSAVKQTVSINAIDASGNVSAAGQYFSFTPVANPTFPSIGLAGPQPTNVVVGQALQIQLTDSNVSPRSFAFQTAPIGATIDSATGLIAWTPAYENTGIATFTVRATNANGYRDFTLSFPVAFTGAAPNVAYSRTGSSSATASWTAPLDTTHIAGYYVYQTWTIGSRTYSQTYTVNSPTTTSLEGLFLVGGTAAHRVRIAAFDGLGRVGLSSPSVSLV